MIISLTEYQLLAKRTCPSLDNDKLDLAHMVLGIFSEYSEYQTAVVNNDITNITEELGDKFWYIANYCTFRNYNLESLWNNKFKNNDFTINISILQDYIKKYVAYNKEIIPFNESLILSNILYNINEMYEINKLDIFESLTKNINKLKVRFPNNFNEQNAIERNLDLEKIELEK